MSNTLKELKDRCWDERPPRLTADEFRRNTCELMSYQLCEFFESKNKTVDDEMRETIMSVFNYILIKNRKHIIRQLDRIKTNKTDVEAEMNHYSAHLWGYLNKGKEYYNRKDYLKWVHHTYSCGITRKQLVDYMCSLAFKNTKVIDCIYKLKDVRNFIN